MQAIEQRRALRMEENDDGAFVANNKSKPLGRSNYEKNLLVGRKEVEKKKITTK